MFNNFINHFKTVCIHKYFVFYYMLKAGRPFRGFMHDWSKFNHIEFFESVKYFDGKISPIVKCKQANGYSLAWQHHKGRNPHHYEYWVDNLDNGGVAIKMPYEYVIELICDYLAAGRTYRGKDFTYEDELAWWKNKLANEHPKIHTETIDFITFVFTRLANGTDKLGPKVFERAKEFLKY